MSRHSPLRRVAGALAVVLVTVAGLIVVDMSPAAAAAPITPIFNAATPIENYAQSDPQTTCDPTEKPGVVAYRNLLNNTYGNHTSYITRACSEGGTSEHKEGRALDYMLNVDDPADNAVANGIFGWLFATDAYGNQHAAVRRLGIMYMIWNHRIWRAYRAGEGWQPYDGDNPHTDHIHFSFSWPGARQQTSWWSGVRAVRHAANYFDWDTVSDRAVWRPSTGTWFVWNSTTGQRQDTGDFGLSGDQPVPGDYDGDGRSDKAVWRPSTGTWFIWYSSTGQRQDTGSFGLSGDRPVPGDYDGDGSTDRAVWRPATGTWYIWFSSTGVRTNMGNWGLSDDQPVPGDYDGDGVTDRAVWQPSSGKWFVWYSSTGVKTDTGSWGQSGDQPMAGDYDGDGWTDRTVWRPSTGGWYVWSSATHERTNPGSWGQSGDIPVRGDYDGDGRTDKAVWRPSTGTWFVWFSSTGQRQDTGSWGASGDVPLG
jgi:hypothetical protein